MDPQKTTGDPKPVTLPADPPADSSSSNWDDHKNTMKLKTEISKLRQEKADRIEADTARTKATELKKLEDAQNYDEIKKLHASQLAEKDEKHSKEILDGKLGLELAKATFTNDKFVKGAIADYDAEQFKTPAAYVESLVADEANKMFLAGSEGLPQYKSPVKTPSGGGGGALSGDQIRALQTSDSGEDQMKAVAYLDDYFNKNNRFPEGFQ